MGRKAMVIIFRFSYVIALIVSLNNNSFAQSAAISVDDDTTCSAMASALPKNFGEFKSSELDALKLKDASSRFSSSMLITSWSEFVTAAHNIVEKRFHLGTSVVIATKMPFEDKPGTIYNPGCYYNSNIYLSKAFIEFSFNKSKPERSPVAIGLLFHEIGHAFSTNYVGPGYPSGAFGEKLRSIPKANELFSDYFAGYMFYFWHKWVRRNLDPEHPSLGPLIQYISSLDHFVWTFKYFGCYVTATSHGDYAQRQKAFIDGGLAAEAARKDDINNISDADLHDIAVKGASKAITISKMPSAIIKPDRCD